MRTFCQQLHDYHRAMAAEQAQIILENRKRMEESLIRRERKATIEQRKAEKSKRTSERIGNVYESILHILEKYGCGMTRADLAKRLGVKPDTMSNYLNHLRIEGKIHQPIRNGEWKLMESVNAG